MALMDFAEIPFDWRVPGALVEVRPDRTGLGTFAWPARVLLAGQKYSAGLAAANVPQRIFTAAQAASLFGAGSQAHRMCQAFLLANPTTELWAAGQADLGGATAATGTFVFSGTPTAAGSMAGSGRHEYPAAVAGFPRPVPAPLPESPRLLPGRRVCTA